MRRYINCIAAVYCTIITISCDDIIEEDITDGLITTIAPLDMETIKGNSVQFRWNGINGADEYRLQINDSTTNSIVLDSLVTTTAFDYTMKPGSYAWRVRGENFAYNTPFSFDTKFKVVLSEILTDQVVIISVPANNKYYNAATLPTTISWQSIPSATGYKIQISKIENDTPVIVYNNNGAILTTNSTTISASDIPGDGEYTCEIQAINADNDTNTDFASHTFFVDTQNPPAPVLVAPIVGATVAVDEEIKFTWTYTDTGDLQSSIKSEIQISDQIDFSQNIITIPVNSTETESDYIFDTAGSFFWRVRGLDDAGNIGEYSDGSQIIVN